MEKNHVNDFVYYLSDKSEFVGRNNYGERFNDYPIDEMEAELERLNIVTHKLMSGGKLYMLTQPSKNDLKHLPRQFENDPWGFWLDKEKKQEDAESSDKWYMSQNAKQHYDDYPKIIKQRNEARVIAIVAIVVSIVLGILQSKCR